jgi:hypothetical protein
MPDSLILTKPLDRRGVPGLIDLPAGTGLVIGAYFAILLWVALSVPFPTRIDELHHYSVIRAQYEQPALFPDWSRYLLVRQDDLSQWSDRHNYINHPSLYYLMLAPLMALGGDPLLFRLVNVAIATLTLVIGVVAVRRRFAATVVSPVWFAILAASFPKNAVVGGLINNDNLAALAASALFAGVLGLPGASWWIMIGLAVAGWTKLTAFLALASVVGVWLGLRLIRRDLALSDPLLRFVFAGLAIGAIPYLVNLLTIGHVLWVSDHWRVPVAKRAHYDVMQFASYFLRSLLWKWPAAEGVYPLSLVVAILLATLGVAGVGLRAAAVRPVVLAYGAGIVILVAIHLIFGWRSFQTMGDLTIAQTRYYNVLWPGVALAAAAGSALLARRWRLAPYAIAALYLAPTMIGSFVRAIV